MVVSRRTWAWGAVAAIAAGALAVVARAPRGERPAAATPPGSADGGALAHGARVEAATASDPERGDDGAHDPPERDGPPPDVADERADASDAPRSGAGAPEGRTAAPESKAASRRPEPPPPLTDPLTFGAGRVPGPTASSSGRVRAPSARPEPRPAPAIGLYGEADNALVAGRGAECLALLDRADAAAADGPPATVREREQRAASPVVRAQCEMLVGRCDRGAARLRAAGWADGAVGAARSKLCPG